MKKFRQRDREPKEQLSREQQLPLSLSISHEVYLLQKYRWLILANQSNLRYHTDARMNSHFLCLMNTYDYEDALFRLDPTLENLRNLKALYIQFNSRNAGNPLAVGEELDDLILLYQNCRFSMFRNFADLLVRFREPIINSFIMVENMEMENSVTAAFPMVPWNP